MNKLTVVTVVMLALLIGSLVNTIWNFSVWSLIGFALMTVLAFWVVTGCARNHEPLAERIAWWHST